MVFAPDCSRESVSIPYGTIKSFAHLVIAFDSAVSIPYGTIKSKCIFVTLTFSDVSIPYGTIKRFSQKLMTQRTTLFQFLMVQLKEI